MKRILIDLDVVTTALWDSKKDAIDFLERIKRGEFEVYTPFAILNTLSLWKHENLKGSIKEFYDLYSTRIISAQEYVENSSKLGVNDKKVSTELARLGIKEEDALLVVVSSVFKLDAIITYNRKHLHRNKMQINKLLRRYKLNEISILLPNEL